MMNESGEEYMVRQGKSHGKGIEDTVSSATSSWPGSTDLHGEQDSTAQWFVIRPAHYSHLGEL